MCRIVSEPARTAGLVALRFGNHGHHRAEAECGRGCQTVDLWSWCGALASLPLRS
jgi:hypothetical protein